MFILTHHLASTFKFYSDSAFMWFTRSSVVNQRVSLLFPFELGITITTQEYPFAPCLSSRRWLNELCFFSLSFTHEHTHTVQMCTSYIVHIVQLRFLQHLHQDFVQMQADRPFITQLLNYPCNHVVFFDFTTPLTIISLDD